MNVVVHPYRCVDVAKRVHRDAVKIGEAILATITPTVPVSTTMLPLHNVAPPSAQACGTYTYRVIATYSIAQGDHARVKIIAYLQRDLVANVGNSSARLAPAGVATRLENHRVRSLLSNRNHMRVDTCTLSTGHGTVVGRLGNEVALKVKDLPAAAAKNDPGHLGSERSRT
jgi:hypothetical protein